MKRMRLKEDMLISIKVEEPLLISWKKVEQLIKAV